MIANYHSHTVLCRHATGTMEEYVLCAMERDLKIFGFSDHAPQWFSGDYYSTMRMYPHELSEYCEQVRLLKEKYADKIEILLGLEVEYYPEIFPELINQLQDHGVEYMLLGQHWSGNEYGEPYNGKATDDVQALKRYCDQTIEAMQTGLFTYFAHPDLLHFVGDKTVYAEQMRRICKEAKNIDMPLEFNMLGFKTNRHYPSEIFWELAAEEGCKAILGIDAHKPEDVTELQPEHDALEILRKYDIELLETVPLKKI